MSGARPQPAAEPSPEDEARANFYALLACLFYGAPDGALLGALASADEIAAESDDSALALAWRDLKRAAAAADEAAVQREYFDVFVGVGRAEVSPYAGAYSSQSESASPLVSLREFLAAHGLARREGVHEPEDHIAALSDVLRHLIVEQQESFEAQRAFFTRFLWPAVPGFCSAANASERTRFYKAVVQFARCFYELEHSAFDMH